jgi:hypothetical protein
MQVLDSESHGPPWLSFLKRLVGSRTRGRLKCNRREKHERTVTRYSDGQILTQDGVSMFANYRIPIGP